VHYVERISEGAEPQIRDEALMSVPDLMDCPVIGEYTPLDQTAAQNGMMEGIQQEIWAHVDHAEKKFCHQAGILGLKQ
jgi:hypothetical protein